MTRYGRSTRRDSSARPTDSGIGLFSQPRPHQENSPPPGRHAAEPSEATSVPSGIKALKRKLEREHPLRIAALQSHMRWLEKQCMKYDINPEDARWLL